MWGRKSVFFTFLAVFLPLFTASANEAPVVIKPDKIYIQSLKEVETFRISVHSEKKYKNLSFSIKILENSTQADISFFARNVKWVNKKDLHVFTNIYGKTAKLSLNSQPLDLEITVAGIKKASVQAVFQVHYRGRVLAAVPLEIHSPLGFLNNALKLLKDYRFYFLGLLTFFLFLLLLYKIIISLTKRKIASYTLGKLTVMVSEGESILIERKNNPFDVRLGGFSKKLTLSYRNREVHIKTGLKNRVYSDDNKIELKINRYWEILCEPQVFHTEYGDNKSLSIILRPLVN